MIEIDDYSPLISVINSFVVEVLCIWHNPDDRTKARVAWVWHHVLNDPVYILCMNKVHSDGLNL